MRRLGRFFVVLSISAGLLGGAATACASTGGSVPTVESLIGKGFASLKVTGNPSIGPKQIRIAFADRASKAHLTVRGGCNAWRARFVVRKGRLFLKGQVSGTKMACSKDPDPWIRSKFRKGLKIRARGNRLILTRSAERVRFVFELVPPKRKPIDRIEEDPEPEPRVTVPATRENVDGKKYELIDTIGKKLDSGLKIGFRDGLRPVAGGELVPVSLLGFHAGCNRIDGEYGIEDGVLSWTSVLTTDVWCQGPDDAWLYSFLTGGPRIGLDGTDLVLRKNGIELVLAQVGESGPDPEPRVTVPATMEDVLERTYEAISVIGPDLERPLEIGFATGTRGSPGDMVTGPGLGLYAGCNHLGGWASIENGVLSWTEVITTLIDCRGTQDDWLIPFFRNDPEIGLDGTDLVIRKNGVEIAFEEIQN